MKSPANETIPNQFRTLRGALPRALRVRGTAWRWALALGASACLSLAGCESAPSQTAATAQVSGSDAGVAPSEQVMSVMQGLEAHTVDLGNDHLRVELRRLDGRTEFAADFQPDGANYRVKDQLYALDADAGPGGARSEERLLPRRPGQLLTAKTAVQGALFLHGNLTSAARGDYAANNYYGCDLGPLGRRSSCSDVGACCDVHDQCYRDNKCTAASWLEKADSVCQTKCNSPALSCFLYEKPGPSACCKDGADYCGQLEMPGEPTPTQATPADVPRWGGVKQWYADTSSQMPAATGTAARPSTQTPVATRPQGQTATNRPATTATASRPSTQTPAANKPQGQTVTNKPSSTAANKPQNQTTTNKPSSTGKTDAGVAARNPDTSLSPGLADADAGIQSAGDDSYYDCDPVTGVCEVGCNPYYQDCVILCDPKTEDCDLLCGPDGSDCVYPCDPDTEDCGLTCDPDTENCDAPCDPATENCDVPCDPATENCDIPCDPDTGICEVGCNPDYQDCAILCDPGTEDCGLLCDPVAGEDCYYPCDAVSDPWCDESSNGDGDGQTDDGYGGYAGGGDEGAAADDSVEF